MSRCGSVGRTRADWSAHCSINHGRDARPPRPPWNGGEALYTPQRGGWPGKPVPVPNHVLVPPASVSQMGDGFPMRPSAVLAAALGALETHLLRQLRPIDRIEQAAMLADGHQASLSVSQMSMAGIRETLAKPVQVALQIRITDSCTRPGAGEQISPAARDLFVGDNMGR